MVKQDVLKFRKGCEFKLNSSRTIQIYVNLIFYYSSYGITSLPAFIQAFGAGADFVMMGGMLAGHDQSGGEIMEKNGKKVRS